MNEMRKRLGRSASLEDQILGKLRDRSLTLAAGGLKNQDDCYPKAEVTTQVSSKETKEG